MGGSQEWGREGSSDCGRVAIEEIGANVSKSGRHSGGLCIFRTYFCKKNKCRVDSSSPMRVVAFNDFGN